MGASKSKAGRVQPPRLRIFIVDDEPMLLELAAKILEPLKFEIQTFTNPSKAVQVYAAANPPPDLVITDFAMHQMDGMDLIRECRRIHPNQKIILLSGTVDKTIFDGTLVRPDRFMEKPYLPRQLVELVQSVLED
jgi:CheY-like chemotaxis protein